MRVLIVAAVLALAVAAPSGDLKEAVPLAVLPVVTPTIDPGDIEAAAINAKVNNPSTLAAPFGDLKVLVLAVLPVVTPTVDPGDIEAAPINAKVNNPSTLAAPSGDLKVLVLAVLPVVTLTIDPGDIEAAAINAKVAAEDQARAAVDKIVEENNEKVIESDSLVKEKTEETFWAGEEKKWQALDAVQTAAAKIDGAVASNADAIAKSAIGGVVLPTYISPTLLPAPVVRAPIVPGSPISGIPIYGPPIISPISPIVYTPGIVAKKEEEKEKLVKTAEPEKDKKVVQIYPGQIVSAPVFSPISPITYTTGISTKDENKNKIVKTADSKKDKQQVLQTIYQTRIISPSPYFYYNPNILIKQGNDVKETEKQIVKIAESERDKQQVLLYQARIVTAPLYSPIYLAYSSESLAKKQKISENNEVEKDTEIKKEENILEENKEKPLEKADKDKLEKPLIAPIVPLVAPQPWPLSPVAPVYVPQQVLSHW